MLDIERDTKILKKEEEKRKWETVKQQDYLFHFNFLYKKIDILLKNIFGKT